MPIMNKDGEKLTNIDTITSGRFPNVMRIFKLFALETG